MPRDGSGVYSYPPGSPGAPNTTIESAKYNALIADFQTDANTPRPVVAGGTGGTTPATARAGIGLGTPSAPSTVGLGVLGAQTAAEAHAALQFFGEFKTFPYTLAKADSGKLLLMSPVADDVVITLPAATVPGLGFFATIRNFSNAYRIIVRPQASGMLDGVTTDVYLLPQQSMMIYCAGGTDYWSDRARNKVDYQTVTNFNTHIWKNGPFYASAGIAGAPTGSSGNFMGFATLIQDSQSDINLIMWETGSTNTIAPVFHLPWHNQKISGVYTGWAQAQYAFSTGTMAQAWTSSFAPQIINTAKSGSDAAWMGFSRPGAHLSALGLDTDGIFKVSNSGVANSLYYLGSVLQSLSGNGYVRFPSGITIQWGTDAPGSGANRIVTFPTTFTSACWCVQACPVGIVAGAAELLSCNVYSQTTSQFNLQTRQQLGAATNSAYLPVIWMAIGN